MENDENIAKRRKNAKKRHHSKTYNVIVN